MRSRTLSDENVHSPTPPQHFYYLHKKLFTETIISGKIYKSSCVIAKKQGDIKL